jgi:hypothetical protein
MEGSARGIERCGARDIVSGGEERRWIESGGGGGGEIDMVRWGMRRRGGWVWLGV